MSRKESIKSQFDRLIDFRKYGRYVGIFFVVLFSLSMTFDNLTSVYIQSFLKPVAYAGYYGLKLSGIPVTLYAVTLPLGFCNYVLPDLTLLVNFGCTGIYVFFVFCAAIAAYPARLRAKGIGILIGTPLFMVYSVLRLIIMGYVGYLIPQHLTIIHSFLMVVINIAFMLWLYTKWIEYAVQKYSQ